MTLYDDFIKTVKEIGHLPEVSVRRVVELTKELADIQEKFNDIAELEKRIAELKAQQQK